MIKSFSLVYGGVAQLARAPALQAGGHRFDSVHLHHKVVIRYLNTISSGYFFSKKILL